MPNKMLNPNEVLTTPQACDLLGITRQTLYAWRKLGMIKPWMRGGGSWLFVRSEVLKAKDIRYQRVPRTGGS